MPERFSRLTIMNTWLHHPEYEYSDALRDWNQSWHKGGQFHQDKPNMSLLILAVAGLVPIESAAAGEVPDLSGEALNMYNGFFAPIKSMPDEAYNGMRRFPLSLCFDNYDGGNSAAQTYFYKTLLNWQKPVHFIWGCSDEVFTETWGRQWAEQMNATFSPIQEARHFLQNTHGKELADIFISKISQE